MTEKDAWDALVLHCRWLGIPVKNTAARFIRLNEHIGKVLATTNQYLNWKDHFKGAFLIRLAFPKNSSITWEKISALVHEMGHILHYRENLFCETNEPIKDERNANQQAKKIIKLLNLPLEKINPHLKEILQSYRKVFSKKENKNARTS